MSLAAFGFKALIARDSAGTETIGSRDRFRIEERRAHAKGRCSQQNALAGLIFCADLGLAREKWRKKLTSIIGPERRFRTQRKQHAIIAVESKIFRGVESDRALRQPEKLVGNRRRRAEAGCGERVVIVAQRIESPSGDQLNAPWQMNAILNDSS